MAPRANHMSGVIPNLLVFAIFTNKLKINKLKINHAKNKTENTYVVVA